MNFKCFVLHLIVVFLWPPIMKRGAGAGWCGFFILTAISKGVRGVFFRGLQKWGLRGEGAGPEKLTIKFTGPKYSYTSLLNTLYINPKSSTIF